MLKQSVSPDSILNRIEAFRACNNISWMQILQFSLIHEPAKTVKVLEKITQNDQKVTSLYLSGSLTKISAIRVRNNALWLKLCEYARRDKRMKATLCNIKRNDKQIIKLTKLLIKTMKGLM